jgi:APA family basic amino acid/polyamine antiporter
MSTFATRQERPATDEPAPAFQQRLGLFDSTMLVVGTMIGSGIFILPAVMARDVGAAGWLLLAWVVTGLVTIFGALSYAELAAMMPHAGGQYVYLREAFSPFWAFLYGWTLFLVIQTGLIAAVAVAFAKYLGVLVPQLGTKEEAGAAILYRVAHVNFTVAFRPPWMDRSLTFFQVEEFQISAGHLVALAVVVVLTLLNCRGIREGKWVQNLFTVAKTLAVVVLIVLGLAVAANSAAIGYNTRDWWGGITETKTYREVLQLVPQGGALVVAMVVGATMVYSLFAADAWHNVTFTAGEVRNPRRNLPLSLALGTGLVIVLYLLANVTYLAALPLPAIAGAKDDRVATAVMELVSPRLAVPFMAGAIMVSTFGCVNGLVLMGARSYYAMARDGLFFRSVGRLNARGVPAAGLLLQGLWSIVLIFSGTYEALTEYAVFAELIFYALTLIGLFVLRKKLPHAERPYKALGYPVIPAVYVLFCTAIMLNLLIVKPAYSWAGLLVVFTGVPVYFLWRLGGRRAAS